MHFTTKKATQAAAVLLRCEHNRMEYIRLLKLLYIADRESLKETGRPITYASPVAMDHGPVPSEVYDLVKGERLDEHQWAEHIEKQGHSIALADDPGRSELSPHEIAKLNSVSTRFEHIPTWDIVEITHGFEEFKQNAPEPKSSKPIPLRDILNAVGCEADADDVLKELHDKAIFDKFFEGTSR